MNGPDPPPDLLPGRAKITLAGGRLSNVSGLVTAAIMAVSFLLSAILIPVAAHLPRWIEFELVLTFWWMVWFAVSVTLLYQGVGVQDDVSAPHMPSGVTSGCLDADPSCNGCVAPIGDGCGEIFGWIFLAIIFWVAIWFIVELMLPALAFAIYWIIVRLLGRIVNDRHDCKGSVVRSVFWGFVWATVYTLPLVATVWGFRFLHHRV